MYYPAFVPTCSLYLRYHGRWIDSVWKSRPYAVALKGISETSSFSESLMIIEYNHIFEIFQKVNVAVILKEIPRNTASLKLVRFRA